MSLNFPVTLVIPILNEAESLPELLQALKAQSHRPDEIIFSDAGSTDGSPALIEAWWRDQGWEDGSCSVLLWPGAMPGAGRNAGVRAARNDWIAFIDGGITPTGDWLEQLCRHALAKKVPAVFGVCHFSAQAPFAKAVCALSYGHGAIHPVIPASMFVRRVFEEIGEFPAHLRAGEDLVWMAALQARYGAWEVCQAARVSYTHFPTGWYQALRKWRVTELHCVLAGVRTGQQAVYLFGLPILYALAGAGGGVGAAVFVVYLLLRGVIDPTRRSLDRPWWGRQPGAACIALPLVAALDIAKWLGIVQGIGARLAANIGFGGNGMSTVEAWQPVFVGAGQVRYYSLARHALVEALRLAGVREGCRVLLPEYLCRDLLAPLHLLGAVPCWYPIAPDMTPATAPAAWPLADVVLAVNFFGFPQDLAPFLVYAERTSAVVIEDNAHGYLSRDKVGQWLGCRTGLGVFSLRKTLRIPDGGALWVGAEYAARELPAQVAFDGKGANPAQLTKVRLRSLPVVGEWAYRLSTGLARTLRKWRTGSDIPAADPASEQTLPAAANPWAGLLPALAACAVPAEIARRRAAYVRCAAIGEQVGALPVFAVLPPHCAPYAFAFRGDAAALAGMRRHAVSHGFDLVSWPDLPTEIVDQAPAHYRNVFSVNFLW